MAVRVREEGGVLMACLAWIYDVAVFFFSVDCNIYANLCNPLEVICHCLVAIDELGRAHTNVIFIKSEYRLQAVREV